MTRFADAFGDPGDLSDVLPSFVEANFAPCNVGEPAMRERLDVGVVELAREDEHAPALLRVVLQVKMQPVDPGHRSNTYSSRRE